jgi:hypothetical protein
VEKSSLTQDAIQSSYYPSQPATISVGFRMGNHHPQPNLQLKITGMTEVTKFSVGFRMGNHHPLPNLQLKITGMAEVTVYELGFESEITIIYPTYSHCSFYLNPY